MVCMFSYSDENKGMVAKPPRIHSFIDTAIAVCESTIFASSLEFLILFLKKKMTNKIDQRAVEET